MKMSQEYKMRKTGGVVESPGVVIYWVTLYSPDLVI